jgi:hypothetical protein
MFVGGSLVGMALIRKAVGEGFVSSLSLQSALTRPFEQMAIGPVTSMAMFFYRPWNSLPAEFAAYWQFLVPIFVGLVIVLGLLSSRWCSAGRQPPIGRRLGKLALAGLVLLVMAYPLTFTVDAATIDGRDTRVHLAAAIGGAVLWGCLCAFLLSRSQGSWLRFPAVTVLALLFTGMFAFGFSIQRDYRLAWEYQRGFWTDVTRSCPDLGRDTVILVEEKGLKQVRQINPWGWDMPYTFTKMYDILDPWTPMPLLYGLKNDWRDVVAQSGNLLDGVNLKGWRPEKLENPTFILLENRDGKLQRAEGPLRLGEHTFELRPLVPRGEPPYRRRLFYEMLMLSEGHQVDYIDD